MASAVELVVERYRAADERARDRRARAVAALEQARAPARFGLVGLVAARIRRSRIADLERELTVASRDAEFAAAVHQFVARTAHTLLDRLAAPASDLTHQARELASTLADSARLADDCQRQELMIALGSGDNGERLLPRAELAVARARCQAELLAAQLVTDSPPLRQALGDVIDKLGAAGAGPGQQWRDQIAAANRLWRAAVELDDGSPYR